MDEHGENHMDSETVGIEVEPAEKADGLQEYDPAEWSKPPRKDPKTGRFLPGTGGSTKGGRPKNSRDKITTTMIRLAEDVAAEHGQEMFEKLAKTDPAACLALITRLLPATKLGEAIDGESEADKAIDQITINLVSSPSPRLSDSRSEEDIQARQRGLEAPVERIERPTEDDSLPPWDPPTQEEMDALAAAEKRQRDAIKAHGGLTGRRARSAAPDTIEYPDEGEVI